MARRVFFSFHYDLDNWRASLVRNIGAIDGNKPCSDNDWETVTRSGDAAIKKWIGEQMNGRSCTVVLIGSGTAGRKWIDYEIKKAWNDGKGVVGVHVHNLKNVAGNQSTKGANPFDRFTVRDTTMSSIVRAYDPPFSTSTGVYNHIRESIDGWIEEAITIRGKY